MSTQGDETAVLSPSNKMSVTLTTIKLHYNDEFKRIHTAVGDDIKKYYGVAPFTLSKRIGEAEEELKYMVKCARNNDQLVDQVAEGERLLELIATWTEEYLC